MQKLTFFILFITTATAFAQSKTGITRQPDTSFTNYSAYQNAKKKYPQIQLVKDSLPPTIKVDKNITYIHTNEQALQLDVFSPKKPAKKYLPAIIIIHGGGWRSGNRTQHYPLAQRLAEHGYVTITPAYRLSTYALYPAAVDDLKASVNWVKAHAARYGINKQQLVVLGFSAGGQLATLLGTTVPGIKAIVDIDGTLAFIHPESGEGDDSKKTSAGTYWFGYNKTEKPDLWVQAGALAHVGAKTPPTLFINSSLDRMHAGRTDYINALNQHYIYSEVHTFPDSPHTFCLFEPWFTPTVNYITGFLAKVLK